MVKAKDIALVGIYAAVLLAAQFALSFVAGVEIVTALLVCFAFSFGFKRSFALVNCFIVLRSLIFGFFLSVFVLYLIYYNIFALAFSLLGKRMRGKRSILCALAAVAMAAVFTVCFTLLDDVITPLFYGFSIDAAKAYFIASLPTMCIQTVCAVITVALLFIPLTKICRAVAKN